MNQQNELEQFNLLQITLYHLFPSLPILFVVVVCSNPIWGFGFPIFLSLMIAIILGLLPTQWIIMYMYARKNGMKIKNIIGFTEKMPVSKTIIFAVPCLLFALFIFMVIAPVEHPIWTIFDWIPNWFRIDRFVPGTQEKSLLMVTVILNFIFNGFAGPLTEELYFRGFLLPRMNKLGKIAPLTNIILFSMYHLFTPWENITRILALTPFVYTVWFNKNIRIGMVIHCSLNTLSCIGMFFSMFTL